MRALEARARVIGPPRGLAALLIVMAAVCTGLAANSREIIAEELPDERNLRIFGKHYNA
jgi:hypothetical protein